jgi:hypothetical protein
MENEFLSIKQASKKYKVSASTITRFVREHQKTKFAKKEKGKFLILDSLLNANFEKVENKELTNQDNQDKPKKESDNLIVDTLKSENEFLRSQLVGKDKQIDTLLQRQLESNTIIQTLQSNLSTKIDNSLPLLVGAVKESKQVAPSTNTDNFNFTVWAALLVLLLVVAIIIFLTVK